VNLVGPPSRWLVTLTDGSVVDVWADSMEELAGPGDQRDYRFCALMDISPRDQPGFDVVARTPSNPGRGGGNRRAVPEVFGGQGLIRVTGGMLPGLPEG
jgi:hypothetical protein